MKSTLNDGILTIFLEGHIDSANAAGIEKEINEILAANSPKNVILDAENLTYISSVGLRIILRLRKQFRDLTITNVVSDVYEVLEMTGFTEMMDIQKAYRRLSIEGCEMIGQGSNGVVYRLDPDTIIKVYRNPDSLPDIHRERELARKAFVMGIPTAIPYDVVKVGNSYGSVFELLNARSFSKIVKADPSKLDETVDEFVKLLRQIHSTAVKPGEMPRMKEVALRWAQDLKGALPEAEAEKLIALIEAVPERDTMLHGDYHFNNVMVQNGEVLLIDMDTLCVGHPVFEFGSVFLANKGFGELDHSVTEKFLGIPYELTLQIWRKTLEKYFDTTDDAAVAAYENKAMVLGYTRLLRRTIRRDPENTELINHCKQCLSDLLTKVDSLNF